MTKLHRKYPAKLEYRDKPPLSEIKKLVSMEDVIKERKNRRKLLNKKEFLAEIYWFCHYWQTLGLHNKPDPKWVSKKRVFNIEHKCASRIWKWLIDTFYVNAPNPNSGEPYSTKLLSYAPDEPIICETEHYPDLYK